jgi:hypothetical protein
MGALSRTLPDLGQNIFASRVTSPRRSRRLGGAMPCAIPDALHFIWIGPRLPWFAKLALQSALLRCPGASVALWATHDLSADEHTRSLRDEPRFRLLRLAERTLFEDAPAELPLDLLARLFATLETPAARANIARLLVLACHGGVYLDTDTVTLRDLTPLRAAPAFCGLEHVVWPLRRVRGLSPYRLLGGPARGLLRKACAHLPRGERLFQRVSPWYTTAANNAVLGFAPGHPFLSQMLARVSELSESERQRRYRLGTHLLQEVLAQAGDELGVRQLPPPYFYPLGPEISHQYFRARSDAPSAADSVISPETFVIHWYASVSQLMPYDPARVQRERGRTIFAQVAVRVLSASEQPT